MSSTNRNSDFTCDHLVIAGVGLIGGSIARSVKHASPATRVTGWGRNRERLLQAQQAGVIDTVATSPDEVEDFDLAVVCTPVDRIVDDVLALADVCPPRALITDAGSVKGDICQALIGLDSFIGSHPMAGSEKGGWEHSQADLFLGKTCIVSPTTHSQEVLDRIGDFWKLLGMQVRMLPPQKHDELVALTSHLPHAVAAVLASLLTIEAAPLASTGFRDTTRVASGDPELWTSIFQSNREAVSQQLERFLEKLGQFREALHQNSGQSLHAALVLGQTTRDQWLCSRPDLRPPAGPAS